MHTVKAVFTFKDNESKDKFIDFCNGEKGLDVTRGWHGCQSIECYEGHENRNQIVIWQKWETKEDHESYVKHRHDDGSFDFLGDLIASPPEIVPLRPVNFKNDRDQILEIINDMCDIDHSKTMKHLDEDFVFIRPTGNPLDLKSWNEMLSSSDINVESHTLVKVDKINVNGDMAYVCYTSHSKFSYKGTENDDLAVLTCILERKNGVWKIVLGQRSTGRKLEENESLSQ